MVPFSVETGISIASCAASTPNPSGRERTVSGNKQREDVHSTTYGLNSLQVLGEVVHGHIGLALHITLPTLIDLGANVAAEGDGIDFSSGNAGLGVQTRDVDLRITQEGKRIPSRKRGPEPRSHGWSNRYFVTERTQALPSARQVEFNRLSQFVLHCLKKSKCVERISKAEGEWCTLELDCPNHSVLLTGTARIRGRWIPIFVATTRLSGLPYDSCHVRCDPHLQHRFRVYHMKAPHLAYTSSVREGSEKPPIATIAAAKSVMECSIQETWKLDHSFLSSDHVGNDCIQILCIGEESERAVYPAEQSGCTGRGSGLRSSLELSR